MIITNDISINDNEINVIFFLGENKIATKITHLSQSVISKNIIIAYEKEVLLRKPWKLFFNTPHRTFVQSLSRVK